MRRCFTELTIFIGKLSRLCIPRYVRCELWPCNVVQVTAMQFNTSNQCWGQNNVTYLEHMSRSGSTILVPYN